MILTRKHIFYEVFTLENINVTVRKTVKTARQTVCMTVGQI